MFASHASSLISDEENQPELGRHFDRPHNSCIHRNNDTHEALTRRGDLLTTEAENPQYRSYSTPAVEAFALVLGLVRLLRVVDALFSRRLFRLGKR
jgi:hypothetical protein